MYELQVLVSWTLPIMSSGIFAIAGALVGQAKGRTTAGALWGLFLGPIGLIVACLIESRIERPAWAPSPSRVASLIDNATPEQLRAAFPERAGEAPPATSDLRDQAQRTRDGYLAMMKARKERSE